MESSALQLVGQCSLTTMFMTMFRMIIIISSIIRRANDYGNRNGNSEINDNSNKEHNPIRRRQCHHNQNDATNDKHLNPKQR